jgi:hypothetical protein
MPQYYGMRALLDKSTALRTVQFFYKVPEMSPYLKKINDLRENICLNEFAIFEFFSLK